MEQSISPLTLPSEGYFIGRALVKNVGPCLIAIQQGNLVFDITSKDAPTMSHLLEMENPISYITKQIDNKKAEPLCLLSELPSCDISLLAPCDLQAIKACGVTFAKSMIERVIEEQAGGNPSKAKAIRDKISTAIGDNLSGITPGSEQADRAKKILIKEGLWSQYLEVGIGKDAEVFTKSQPLSAVGYGDDIGIHPISRWNNPEPEVVLAVNSKGSIMGATLGNDVNLRDIEGKSALLLGKAKDNNASAAIGPFIRLFDHTFSLEDVNNLSIDLHVKGTDGFTLVGKSSMSEISRSPKDLVSQTIGLHHQYPDGFMLYLGTLFAPTKDRDEKGQGFTHHIDDVVTISNDKLGTLSNTVRYSNDCPKWTFGIKALMANLAKRGVL